MERLNKRLWIVLSKIRVRNWPKVMFSGYYNVFFICVFVIKYLTHIILLIFFLYAFTPKLEFLVFNFGKPKTVFYVIFRCKYNQKVYFRIEYFFVFTPYRFIFLVSRRFLIIILLQLSYNMVLFRIRKWTNLFLI